MGALEEALAHRVERITGFSLTDEQLKHRLLQVVAERAEAVGAPSAKAYLELLEGEPAGGGEWSQLISILTNGQTSFFRDREQFAALADVLTALHRQQAPVRIWSAGCSTGEEPYSLAILCTELGIRASIVASDINPRFLERARQACYAAWALRNVNAERRARWFEDLPGGGFRVKAELRALVEIRRHNLVLDRPPRPPGSSGLWDVILCRNVFLYFRRDCIAEACRRMASVLAPRGRMLVSASETLRGLEAPLTPEVLRGRVFYHRQVIAPEPAEPRSAAPAPGSHPGRRFPAAPARGSAAAGAERRAPALATAGRGPRPRYAPGPAPQPGRAAAPAGSGAPPIATPPPVRLTGHEPGAPSVTAAAVLARSGRVQDALELVSHPAVNAGHTVVLSLTRGHLHVRLHEIAPALAAYQEAVDTDPLLCEAHYFQGIAHRKAGDWTTAVDVFRRALFLAPGFWQAAYLLAGAYDRLGRVHDAARERTRARRLLRDRVPGVAFLSHPVFVQWLSVREDDVRRLLKIA